MVWVDWGLMALRLADWAAIAPARQRGPQGRPRVLSTLTATAGSSRTPEREPFTFPE